MLETPAPPAGGMIDEAGRRDDPERDRLAVLALLLAARGAGHGMIEIAPAGTRGQA